MNFRGIFLKDSIPQRPENSLLPGRQTSIRPLRDVVFHEITSYLKFSHHQRSFQKWLANFVDFLKPPSVYVKHVNYVNFTQ